MRQMITEGEKQTVEKGPSEGEPENSTPKVGHKQI
jgi:hypothetical protein